MVRLRAFSVFLTLDRGDKKERRGPLWFSIQLTGKRSNDVSCGARSIKAILSDPATTLLSIISKCVSYDHFVRTTVVLPLMSVQLLMSEPSLIVDTVLLMPEQPLMALSSLIPVRPLTSVQPLVQITTSTTADVSAKR